MKVAIVKSSDLGNRWDAGFHIRSEEHTSELQSLMRNSYAVFCLKKKKIITSISTFERWLIINQSVVKRLHIIHIIHNSSTLHRHTYITIHTLELHRVYTELATLTHHNNYTTIISTVLKLY